MNYVAVVMQLKEFYDTVRDGARVLVSRGTGVVSHGTGVLSVLAASREYIPFLAAVLAVSAGLLLLCYGIWKSLDQCFKVWAYMVMCVFGAGVMAVGCAYFMGTAPATSRLAGVTPEQLERLRGGGYFRPT